MLMGSSFIAENLYKRAGSSIGIVPEKKKNRDPQKVVSECKGRIFFSGASRRCQQLTTIVYKELEIQRYGS